MPKGVGSTLAQNKKAGHDYFIEETFEAGIVLQGTEIKSIRAGKVNLRDSFVRIDRNEAFVQNSKINWNTKNGWLFTYSIKVIH